MARGQGSARSSSCRMRASIRRPPQRARQPEPQAKPFAAGGVANHTSGSRKRPANVDRAMKVYVARRVGTRRTAARLSEPGASPRRLKGAISALQTVGGHYVTVQSRGIASKKPHLTRRLERRYAGGRVSGPRIRGSVDQAGRRGGHIYQGGDASRSDLRQAPQTIGG